MAVLPIRSMHESGLKFFILFFYFCNLEGNGKTILIMHITKYNSKKTEKEISQQPKFAKNCDNYNILIELSNDRY